MLNPQQIDGLRRFLIFCNYFSGVYLLFGDVSKVGESWEENKNNDQQVDSIFVATSTTLPKTNRNAPIFFSGSEITWVRHQELVTRNSNMFALNVCNIWCVQSPKGGSNDFFLFTLILGETDLMWHEHTLAQEHHQLGMVYLKKHILSGTPSQPNKPGCKNLIKTFFTSRSSCSIPSHLFGQDGYVEGVEVKKYFSQSRHWKNHGNRFLEDHPIKIQWFIKHGLK